MLAARYTDCGIEISDVRLVVGNPTVERRDVVGIALDRLILRSIVSGQRGDRVGVRLGNGFDVIEVGFQVGQSGPGIVAIFAVLAVAGTEEVFD